MAKDYAQESQLHCLGDAYKELALLQLKYENLIDLCTMLLRPWPHHDNKGAWNEALRAEEEMKTAREAEECDAIDPMAEISVSVIDPTGSESRLRDQLEAVEKALNKAQKVRTEYVTCDDHIPKAPSFSLNVKLAASVYGTHNKKLSTNKSIPYSHNKGHNTVAKRQAGATVPGGASPVLSFTKTVPKHLTTIKTIPKHPATIEDVKRTSNKETLVQQNPVDCFSLITNGVQLSLPAKYHSLQSRLLRVKEHTHTVTANGTAKNFVGKLVFKKEVRATETCYHQLLKDCYTVLNAQLLTPSQLLESTMWQDLMTMKHQLEYCSGSVTSKTVEKSAIAPLYQPHVLPVYSKIEDWLDMARCEQRRQLQEIELKILDICKGLIENLLPIEANDRSYMEMKRILYNVLGLDLKPILIEE